MSNFEHKNIEQAIMEKDIKEFIEVLKQPISYKQVHLSEEMTKHYFRKDEKPTIKD